nr:MAG TPA: hypothetical protein [Caudoviricetes sp.]
MGEPGGIRDRRCSNGLIRTGRHGKSPVRGMHRGFFLIFSTIE